MKKVLSFVMALVAAMTLNASDYYFVGGVNNWSNGNESYKFVEKSGVLTLEIDSLCGEFKIIEGADWHPQFGAGFKESDETVLPKLELNTAYTLVKEKQDEAGKTVEPANVGINLADKHIYRNAVLTLNVTNADAPVLTLVSGTDVDRSAAPVTYQIVGGFTDNWSTTAAIAFEEVEGVLTATVPDLNGTFKIIVDRSWDMQYATNWDTKAGVEMNVPYVLGAKSTEKGEPANLSIANPFYGYTDAKFTLTEDANNNKVLTLVEGTPYVINNDWYMPSTKLGWNCDAAQMFTAVAGSTNTYELLLAEFEGDFKIVYGSWSLEYGMAADSAKWEINKEYTCRLNGGNVNAAKATAIYTDVTVTLVVDYATATVKVTLASDNVPEAIENTTLNQKATKVIENGQLVILKNGVRYNALGTVIE